MLKFYWNGIKENGGTLQLVSYSMGNYTNKPENTIAVYARKYGRFGAGVREAFTVKNDSDAMTDYFESDRFYVTPDHPLYAEVLAAYNKCDSHRKKMFNKRFPLLADAGATK